MRMILTTIAISSLIGLISPEARAQSWQQWQQQNPTYPAGVTQTQPQPQSVPSKRPLNPTLNSEASVKKLRTCLLSEQAERRGDIPRLHQAVVGASDTHISCLSDISRNGSGQPNPCQWSHQRLLQAQKAVQANRLEIDNIQAELANLDRQPQPSFTRSSICSLKNP